MSMQMSYKSKPGLSVFIFAVCWLCQVSVYGQSSTPSLSDAESGSKSVQRSITFEQANRMFEEGDYLGAVSAYETLIEQGPLTSALLFNASNAYWKSDQKGKAVWRLRQAKAIDPTDPDIIQNLKTVRSELGRPQIEGDLLDSLEGVTNRLSPAGWALLGLLSSWIATGLLIFKQLKSNRIVALFGPLTISGLILTALCVSAAHLAWNSRGQLNDVVTLKDDVPLRFGPLAESKVSIRMPAGSEGVAIDQKDEWIQVEFEGGSKGWTRKGNLGFVFPEVSLSNGTE